MVNFVVDWCPHCQRMLSTFDRVRDDMIADVNTFVINCEQHPDVADMAEVEVYPTSIVYKDGEEVWRGTGEATVDDLENQLKKALGK